MTNRLVQHSNCKRSELTCVCHVIFCYLTHKKPLSIIDNQTKDSHQFSYKIQVMKKVNMEECKLNMRCWTNTH